MDRKNKTAPLFSLPEEEDERNDGLEELKELEPSPAGRRLIASLFDAILIGFFIFSPLLTFHPNSNTSSLWFSFLLYGFNIIFSYHFLFYFFIGRTIGDWLGGIELNNSKFSLSLAFSYSFVKTIFTIVPLNLLFPIFLEKNQTGEQFMFGRGYEKY